MPLYTCVHFDSTAATQCAQQIRLEDSSKAVENARTYFCLALTARCRASGRDTRSPPASAAAVAQSASQTSSPRLHSRLSALSNRSCLRTVNALQMRDEQDCARRKVGASWPLIALARAAAAAAAHPKDLRLRILKRLQVESVAKQQAALALVRDAERSACDCLQLEATLLYQAWTATESRHCRLARTVSQQALAQLAAVDSSARAANPSPTASAHPGSVQCQSNASR